MTDHRSGSLLQHERSTAAPASQAASTAAYRSGATCVDWTLDNGIESRICSWASGSAQSRASWKPAFGTSVVVGCQSR